MNNIYLTGFMGTGKTSVAKVLAQRTGRMFLDLDTRIEERHGMAIADIFALKGEPYFRSLEKNLLRELSGTGGQAVSCGGGVVMDPENIAVMRQTGRIVCLTARPQVILARTAGYAHRPLLNVDDPAAKIEELMQKRAACYAQADLTVDTSDLSVEQVVDRILLSQNPR